MKKFPVALMGADHQYDLFTLLRPTHDNKLKPKLTYRSDSTSYLFLLYIVEDQPWAVWMVPGRSSRMSAIQNYWTIPENTDLHGPERWNATIQRFLSDVQYVINHGELNPEWV